MRATAYRRTGAHRVRVRLFRPTTGQTLDVDYWVGEDTDGSPDTFAAAMQAERDHDGYYYDTWETQ